MPHNERLQQFIEELADKVPTDADRSAIYKLMPYEQILIVNGVMIRKPARRDPPYRRR